MSSPLTLYRPGPGVGRDAQALHRAATPELCGWLEHTASAGGCSHPIVWNYFSGELWRRTKLLYRPELRQQRPRKGPLTCVKVGRQGLGP